MYLLNISRDSLRLFSGSSGTIQEFEYGMLVLWNLLLLMFDLLKADENIKTISNNVWKDWWVTSLSSKDIMVSVSEGRSCELCDFQSCDKYCQYNATTFDSLNGILASFRFDESGTVILSCQSSANICILCFCIK